MDAFRVEMTSHVASLEAIRRTFVELAMMESTIGRVAQVIQPLAQISSLTHLNDDEVRAAARSILDRRATRMSRQTDSAEPERVAEQSGGVPLPPEARQ